MATNQVPTARQDLFERIDEREAWLLGLIWSDGCLNVSRGRRRIVFSSTDIEMAEDAASIAAVRAHVHHPPLPRKPCAAVRIAGLPVQRAELMGLTQRKSFTIGPPPIDDALVPHFVRGYFDGNGTVGAYRNPSVKYGPPRLVTKFCGSWAMMNGIQSWLIEMAGIRQKKVNAHGSVWRLSYNHRESVMIGQWMYQGASVWLDRKRRKFTDYST